MNEEIQEFIKEMYKFIYESEQPVDERAKEVVDCVIGVCMSIVDNNKPKV